MVGIATKGEGQAIGFTPLWNTGLEDESYFEPLQERLMKNARSIAMPALTLALIAVCFYPAIALLVTKWMGSDDYAHAFFTVPIIGYMVWGKRQVFTQEAKGAAFGLLVIVISLLFYLVSLRLQIPTFIFTAFALTLVGVILYLGGIAGAKELLIPVLLLFLLIPIPNQVLSTLTAVLQLKVSEASEFIVRGFGIPVFREGNVLSIPERTFQVVEACSGIRSLISLTTLSVILGYFTLKKYLSISALLLFSIPVAIVINIGRVVSLVLAFHFFSLDLATGTAHTITGLVLFLLGLLMLLGAQRVIEQWETKILRR